MVHADKWCRLSTPWVLAATQPVPKRKLPIYAPHARALVLTDEHEMALDLQVARFDALRRHAPDSMLLDWIDGSAA